jgi:hypothetical protein
LCIHQDELRKAPALHIRLRTPQLRVLDTEMVLALRIHGLADVAHRALAACPPLAHLAQTTPSTGSATTPTPAQSSLTGTMSSAPTSSGSRREADRVVLARPYPGLPFHATRSVVPSSSDDDPAAFSLAETSVQAWRQLLDDDQRNGALAGRVFHVPGKELVEHAVARGSWRLVLYRIDRKTGVHAHQPHDMDEVGVWHLRQVCLCVSVGRSARIHMHICFRTFINFDMFSLCIVFNT